MLDEVIEADMKACGVRSSFHAFHICVPRRLGRRLQKSRQKRSLLKSGQLSPQRRQGKRRPGDVVAWWPIAVIFSLCQAGKRTSVASSHERRMSAVSAAERTGAT